MKIKFPIILKIGLLGILISGIATGAALSISNFYQIKRSKETLIDNIDKSLSTVEYTYAEDADGNDLIDQLENVKSYISQNYNLATVHDKTLEDFSSFEEYEQYFKDQFVWIFPKPGMIIGSKAYLEFRSQYREITHIITEAQLSSGGRAAYMGYFEKTATEDRIVFMNDSRITTPIPGNPFYHLPGSHYTITKNDLYIDEDDEDYYGYEINGYLTRFVPITRQVGGETVPIAAVFIEYDLNDIKAESHKVMLNELLIISIVMVATVFLYMLLSYFTITRNLNKLTKATDNISNNLKEKKNIEPIQLNIKSHDEIASLATSFGVMEQGIINYTEIIKKEAKENERREAELELASSIQLGALPDSQYKDENLDLAAYIKPAKVVGGDFYDYFYNKDEFVIIIADVSGKGISAAMFMMKAKSMLRGRLLGGLSLTEAVSSVNNELTINNESSLFVTAFIASINFKNNEIRFVNAGHEKPYILHNGEVIKLDGTSNFVLGGESDISYVEERREFAKGDTLFMFTDGLNESINKDKEEFGYERIVSTLIEGKELSLKEKIDLFNKNLKQFVGKEEQFDDITLIALNSKEKSLNLKYDKKDYSIITDAIDRFESEFSYLNMETKANVGIALDELLNNLISYEKREDLKIELDFNLIDGGLKVTITSNGADYDPFANHVKKHLTEKDEDVALGGFGVLLVKNATKKQEYIYKNKKSITTLYF